MRFGHKSGTAFLAANHELYFVLPCMKAVKHREITFTGNAESMRDALGNEAVNKKMAGKL